MAAKHSRSIALTAPLLRHIECQVSLGEDASVSDRVHVAPRLLKERDEVIAARSRAGAAEDNAGMACAEV